MSVAYLKHDEISKYLEERRGTLKDYQIIIDDGSTEEKLRVFFYISADEILEVLNHSKPVTFASNNKPIDKSVIICRAGLTITHDNSAKYGKFFEDMKKMDQTPLLSDIHKMLGITKEEERRLFDILEEDFKFNKQQRLKELSKQEEEKEYRQRPYA